MGYKTRSNYPSVEIPKRSIFKRSSKWCWWKLKKPDRIDNWTFAHLLAGMGCGLIATFSPILGSVLLFLLVFWEYFDFWVAINFNINIKYLFDRGGFSIGDVLADFSGYSMIYIMFIYFLR